MGILLSKIYIESELIFWLRDGASVPCCSSFQEWRDFDNDDEGHPPVFDFHVLL